MFFDSKLSSHSSSNPLFVSANLFNNSVEKGESVCDVCMGVWYGCVGVSDSKRESEREANFRCVNAGNQKR